MSNVDGTCEYVLDPDDPETWRGVESDECLIRTDILNNQGKWSCPHSSQNDSKYCIFHKPISQKNNEKTINEFVSIIENENKSTELLGACFKTLNLDGIDKIPKQESAIDLTQSKINNDVSLEDTQVNPELYMTQTSIGGSISLKNSDFSKKIDFVESRVNESCDISNCRFQDTLTFQNSTITEEFYSMNTTFDGEAWFDATFKNDVKFTRKQPDPRITTSFQGFVNFTGAEIHKNIICSGVDFDSSVNFNQANIKGEAYFPRTKFKKLVTFSETEFLSTSEFTAVIFDGKSEFKHTKFESAARFYSSEFNKKLTFQEAEFSGETDFSDAEFFDDVNFENIDFPEATDFSGSKFYQVVSFDKSRLIGCDFFEADLTEASFNTKNMREANFESTLLSRATLFGADLRGVKLSGAVLGDVRVNEETQFLGHPSEDSDVSPHTISAISSRPTCIYDPDYEEKNEHENVDKAKSVYRALEELGRKHARPRLQARSFVRRQDLQKKDYWDDATAGDASLEERFIAGVRWSRAKVARATLLYGESPWRVIAWSLGTIFSFALLYPLGGWIESSGGSPITYGNILESVYFSTLTYTALGFGDFQPIGFGRLLTTLETGLGAVMVALLVFILGRRAAR